MASARLRMLTLVRKNHPSAVFGISAVTSDEITGVNVPVSATACSWAST